LYGAFIKLDFDCSIHDSVLGYVCKVFNVDSFEPVDDEEIPFY